LFGCWVISLGITWYLYFIIETNMTDLKLQRLEGTTCYNSQSTSPATYLQVKDKVDRFQEAMEKFRDFVTGLWKKEASRPETTSQFYVILGKKFLKVYGKPEVGQGSLYCFIDRETGDIYKPASWAAPAKHSRGSIFNEETWKAYTSFGPHYLV
jgi:hypothetical protein